MAERSFVEEVKKLRLGAGEVFRGEGILAVTKALLESGVAYVAGYQGAPISHLMDVLADAQDILAEHGIRFENCAERSDRGGDARRFGQLSAARRRHLQGTVGINVASDALANLASGGVTGGALVIVGEDYGEGSSIMQERSHAFAMKSQIWLLDPRPNLPSMVAAVKTGFELSEASHTPVMLLLRIRACHVHGQFVAGANRAATFTPSDALDDAAARLPRASSCRPRPTCTSRRRSTSAGPRRFASSRSAASTNSSPRTAATSASSSRAACTTLWCAPSSGSAWPTSTATRRSRSTS